MSYDINVTFRMLKKWRKFMDEIRKLSELDEGQTDQAISDDMSIEQLSGIWPEWNAVEMIGEGSYGKVYKVVRKSHGITDYAAVKVITIPQSPAELSSFKADGYGDATARSFFESIVTDCVSEIKLMVTMKGISNIVSVEDYKVVERPGEIGWDIYIRMELLTGFRDYTADKVLSQNDVIRLGQDVCSALEMCAQKKIIHRDIKPENIFVSSFGGFKIGDFGIARELEKTSGSMSVKGTFSYIAPEVVKSKRYDATVDIYSLGVLLYKLLNNNRLPFINPYAEQILYQDNKNAIDRRLSGEALPPPVDASPEMGHAILKACMYEPKLRFKTAAEFKQALEAVKNGTYKIVPFGTSDIYATDRLFDINKTIAGRKVPVNQQAVSEPMFVSQPRYRKTDKHNESFSDANEYGRKRVNKKAVIITSLACVCVIALTIIILPYFNQNGSSDDIPPAPSEIANNQYTPLPQAAPESTPDQIPGQQPAQMPEPTPEAVPTAEPILPSIPHFTNEWIELEVLRIREMWQNDREAISNGLYITKALGSGLEAFFSNGQLKMIEVAIYHDGNIAETRIYQFENDDLIFAYISGGGVQNRLYFHDSVLFRWRHTPDRNNQGNIIDYDNARELAEFTYWEGFALDEANSLRVMAAQ
jgi:serine/threonine protein kinase